MQLHVPLFWKYYNILWCESLIHSFTCIDPFLLCTQSRKNILILRARHVNVRLVIYPMPGNNETLRIDFTDLRKWNLVHSLFETVFWKRYTCYKETLDWYQLNWLNHLSISNIKELNTKILYKFCKFIYNLISTKFL